MNKDQKIKSIRPGSYIVIYNSKKTIDDVVSSLAKKYNIGSEGILELENQNSSIKIGQIRSIKKKIIFKTEKINNILIIKDAQYLTREASNSLLKIIEEPPRKLIILIVVDNISKLLPTIISRCKKIVLLDKLELTSDNRYINLLKQVIDSKEIYKRFSVADKIVKSKADILMILRDWIMYLESNPCEENISRILRIDKYLRKYNKSLNKKLFLENILFKL